MIRFVKRQIFSRVVQRIAITVPHGLAFRNFAHNIIMQFYLMAPDGTSTIHVFSISVSTHILTPPASKRRRNVHYTPVFIAYNMPIDLSYPFKVFFINTNPRYTVFMRFNFYHRFHTLYHKQNACGVSTILFKKLKFIEILLLFSIKTGVRASVRAPVRAVKKAPILIV